MTELGTIFSHYFDLKIKQSANTILVIDEVEVDLGADYSDNDWHNLVLVVKDGGDFDIYIDGSIIPISGNSPGLDGGSDQQMIIGDEGLSLYGLRTISGEMNINDYQINYLDKDIRENDGNVFFEGI